MRLALPLLLLLAGCSGPSTQVDKRSEGKVSEGSAAEAGALAAPPGAGGAPDPDDKLYTLGPVLRGKAVRGVGLKGLPGATVKEVGASTALVSGDGGRFSVDLADQQTVAVLVTAPGFVPTIQIATEQSRPYFEGSFKIEMFEEEDERSVEMEEFGSAQDPALGRLVLNFQPYGSAGGVRAAAGEESWVYDSEDLPVRGALLPTPPGPGEIVFRNLPLGALPVRLETPEGVVCRGPSSVPIQAGVYTRSYYFCQSRDDTAATDEQIEAWRERGGPPHEVSPGGG